MDNEALAASSAPLPDESLNNAPAGSATKVEIAQPQASQPAQGATPPADPTAASAPAKEGEQPNPDAPPQDQPQKFKGGFQKRIDELTRRSYTAEREVQTLRQQIAQGQPAQQSQEFTEPPPNIEKFATLEDYSNALGTWSAKKARHEMRAESEQTTQRQQQERQQQEGEVAVLASMENFKARETDVAAKHADYEQVVSSPLMQGLREHRTDIAAAVIDSPHGPEIAYFLGKNPQAVVQLARLTPVAAAREIGRIESMFMQPRGQQTQAPPPPKTVGGTASAERSPEQMTNREYRAWRSKTAKS